MQHGQKAVANTIVSMVTLLVHTCGHAVKCWYGLLTESSACVFSGGSPWPVTGSHAVPPPWKAVALTSTTPSSVAPPIRVRELPILLAARGIPSRAMSIGSSVACECKLCAIQLSQIGQPHEGWLAASGMLRPKGLRSPQACSVERHSRGATCTPCGGPMMGNGRPLPCTRVLQSVQR